MNVDVYIIISMFGFIFTLFLLCIVFYKKYPAELAALFILLPHMLVGFILQSLQIFSFWYVIFGYVLCTGMMYFVIEKNNSSEGRVNNYKEVFGGCLLIVAVVFSLLPIHTNFTGLVGVIHGNEIVTQSKYLYPQFSDEWVAVQVIETTIAERRLPVSDVFFGKPKFNFLFGFHSLLSQLHVFFSAVPLTAYVFFGVFFSALLVLFAYRLQRVLGVSAIAAFISAASLLYITNGSNLPGLWYLLPWNVGFIILLLGYIFFYKKAFHFSILAFLLAVYVYPPIAMFIAFSCVALLLYEKEKIFTLLAAIKENGVYKIIVGSLFLLLITLCVVFQDAVVLGIKYVIRPLNSAQGTPPSFYLWTVIPLVILFASGIGLRKNIRKHAVLVFPILGGCLLWFLYWLRVPTIVIDYHRTVMITALLIGLYAGVGFDVIGSVLARSFNWSKKLIERYKNSMQLSVMVLLTLLIVITAGWYMQRGNWALLEKKIWNPVEQSYEIISPLPPINHYLAAEDLQLFSNYSNKVFIAPQWKSLVIAVATDNIPLATKPATFTVKKLLYLEFMTASCENKIRLANKYNLDLVYANQFVCAQFVPVGTSTEGLTLYEFQK